MFTSFYLITFLSFLIPALFIWLVIKFLPIEDKSFKTAILTSFVVVIFTRIIAFSFHLLDLDIQGKVISYLITILVIKTFYKINLKQSLIILFLYLIINWFVNFIFSLTYSIKI